MSFCSAFQILLVSSSRLRLRLRLAFIRSNNSVNQRTESCSRPCYSSWAAPVSEIICGKPPSWKDPVKFSFAHSGKDGVPRAVDREAMDKSLRILTETIQNAKIDNKAKLWSFKKLRQYIPSERM